MAQLKTTSGQIVDPGEDKALADQYKAGGAIPVSNQINITPESMNNVSPIVLPKITPDTTNYQGIIDAGTQIAAQANTPPVGAETPQQKYDGLSSEIQKMLGTPVVPTSLSDTYNTLYGQSEIDTKQADVNAKQQIANTATNEINRLSAEMASLNAEAKATPIKIQQDAIGKGVTAGGMAPIETARLRDIALRSLPLEGQILAAQAKVTAAQGDVTTSQNMLTQAQAKFDRAFDIKSQDLTNQYNAKKEQQNNIISYLTSRQATQLEKLQLDEQRAYDESQTAISDAKNLANIAMQAGLPEVASKLSQLDTKSPTFKADLATLQGQIAAKTEAVRLGALQDAKAQQEFENSIRTGEYNLKKEEVKNALAQKAFENGMSIRDYNLRREMFNSDTDYNNAKLILDGMKLEEGAGLTVTEKLKMKEGGYTLDASGNIVKTTAGELEQQNARDVISTIDGLLGPGSSLNSAVGMLDQFKPDSLVGNFKTEFDQLQAKLAFANLDKLKGPMSDKDIQFLKDASSGLNRSMTQEAFRAKLGKIKERFQVTLLNPGEYQLNTLAGDGTYSYRNLDGTVHTGPEGENYVDNTKPPSFSSVDGDTNSAILQKVSKKEDGAKGGQCGAFVNRITGLGVGDSYESKMSKMDPTIETPEPGMVFTMPYKQYGHIGFIVGIDGDQAIVKDSNYKLDEKVATHKIPINKMTGFARV